jgi:Cu+-exporting ATPase
LERADIGIALGASADIAMESADIVLMKDDLEDAIKAFKLSALTIKNIKQNLFWAFFYNVCAIPLAAGAFYHSFGLKLSPTFAAAAMSLSSLFVVTNALRLRKIKIEA